MDDKDLLSKLVEWHEAADEASSESRKEAERDRDYYDGKQWTDDEIAQLTKRKQPIVTINRIKPKIDFLKGQEQQRRQMPRAFPRTPQDEESAEAATDAIRFVMDESKWDRHRSECFDNHAIEGMCGIDVQVYQKGEDYCIDPKPIQWDRMWADPHSRKRDYSDAKYKGQFVWMDYDDAVAKWPDRKDKLDATLASDSARISETYADTPRNIWSDPKRKRIRIAECWYKLGDKWYFVKFTKGGILEQMESPFVDENGDSDDGFVFGSCFIDRDGNRYGVVRAWVSIQDEINKRRSKAMHLMNVRQTFGNQGIGDKNKVRAELAKPDGHVELPGGMKFGEDFGVLPTGDMAAAQFQLLQEAKGEIDSVGVNAALSGKEERVMSGRALMARSEQGQSELGPVFDAFAQFQLDVYRKVWNRIRQFWTGEKWIRVTDDERNVKFVGLNQPLTMGEQMMQQAEKAGQPLTPEEMQAMQADPRMQAVIGTKNNVGELDVDLILDDVPASASLQTETFEQLTQLAPHMATMPPPMFEALIEASPLRNKEKLLKKLRGEEDGQLPPQVQQAMQQHEQTIQELQQALQQAEGQLSEAKAAGPAMDLKVREIELNAREQELRYREQLLQAQKDIAILQVKLQTTQATNQMDKAATAMSNAAKEAQQASEVEEIQS